MLSPIVLFSTPIIIIASLAAAYFFSPELPPELLGPDVQIARDIVRSTREDYNPDWILQSYRYLNSAYSQGGIGHFTSCYLYPFLDIKNVEGVPVLTKNYLGCRGELLKMWEWSPPTTDGLLIRYIKCPSFSWPLYCFGDYERVSVLFFTGEHEIWTDGPLNEFDQSVVDWYRSWCNNEEYSYFKQLFVHPNDPGYEDGNPLCIKLVYYGHQWYKVFADFSATLGESYKPPFEGALEARYSGAITSYTADISTGREQIDRVTLTPEVTPLDLSICSTLSMMSSMYDIDLGLKQLVTIFSQVMVHPVDESLSRDLAVVKTSCAQSYVNFDPGPIVDENGDPVSGSSPLLPKLLIFVACAATLTLCTYIGYTCFA